MSNLAFQERGGYISRFEQHDEGYRGETFRKLFCHFNIETAQVSLGFLDRFYDYCDHSDSCVDLLDYIYSGGKTSNASEEEIIQAFMQEMKNCKQFSPIEIKYIHQQIGHYKGERDIYSAEQTVKNTTSNILEFTGGR